MQLFGMTQIQCAEIGHIVRKYTPDLAPFEEQYKDLHRNPELGKQEHRTASIAAKHLKSLGFEVHEHIGGHGLAGILRCGPGRVVLLRADMDSLVKEEPGLPYASCAHQKSDAGETIPVMHACGHDMHVVCMMAMSHIA